jgi:hypothetical protein
VINPAGILRDGMFHKMPDEDWDQVIDVHLNGAYNVSRAAINHFREQDGGSFVHFTSTSGLIGNIGQANYAAAKMGVVGLSRIIAMEGAAKGVRSNVIAPFAWTRMIATIPVKDEASAKRVERMRNMTRADQIAPPSIALLADGAKDVSGQIFVVRGNEVFLMSQPRPVRGMARIEGWTPLMGASRRGHAGIVKALLAAGADVNAADNSGWTALICACCLGRLESARLLVAAKAPVNARDIYGYTPLNCSRGRGGNADPAIEALLLAAGATAV